MNLYNVPLPRIAFVVGKQAIIIGGIIFTSFQYGRSSNDIESLTDFGLKTVRNAVNEVCLKGGGLLLKRTLFNNVAT